MKKIVNKPVVTEMKSEIVDEADGFVTFLGKKVLLHCMNYNYTGTLVGVNATCLKLEGGGVVFETGPYNSKAFKDMQPVAPPMYVQLSAIESWWEV